MQKTILAAGEAMPSIQRRHLLLGLAAASTAAAVAVLPSPSTSAEITENPELLRLADLMPKAIDDYRAAKAAKREAVATFGPRWPVAPNQITRAGYGGFHSDQEKTLDEKPLIRFGETYARLVSSASSVSWQIKRAERAVRSKDYDRNKNGKHRGHTLAEWQEHLDQLYDDYVAARDHETERDGIKRQSNILDLTKRVQETENVLGDVIKRILNEPENTMAGVIVKAQAIAAASAENNCMLFYSFHPTEGDWGTQLARSVLKHAGQEGKVL